MYLRCILIHRSAIFLSDTIPLKAPIIHKRTMGKQILDWSFISFISLFFAVVLFFWQPIFPSLERHSSKFKSVSPKIICTAFMWDSLGGVSPFSFLAAEISFIFRFSTPGPFPGALVDNERNICVSELASPRLLGREKRHSRLRSRRTFAWIFMLWGASSQNWDGRHFILSSSPLPWAFWINIKFHLIVFWWRFLWDIKDFIWQLTCLGIWYGIGMPREISTGHRIDGNCLRYGQGCAAFTALMRERNEMINCWFSV